MSDRDGRLRAQVLQRLDGLGLERSVGETRERDNAYDLLGVDERNVELVVHRELLAEDAQPQRGRAVRRRDRPALGEGASRQADTGLERG